VPFYGYLPLDVNERVEVVGFLNQIRMGEVTRIGVIGGNGLLRISRFGSRLMLGDVISTTKLPQERFPSLKEPGCPPDCRTRLDVCPVAAVDMDQKYVKIMKCLNYTARTSLMPKVWFGLLSIFCPKSAARLMNLRAFDEHTFQVCSECVARCPYGEKV
jgi:epoxyqueuosine reductase QueG